MLRFYILVSSKVEDIRVAAQQAALQFKRRSASQSEGGINSSNGGVVLRDNNGA